MNEELQNDERNPDLEFERQDLSPKGVYAFLVGLAVAGIVIYFVLMGLYHFLDTYNKTHQPPQNPLVKAETDTRHITPQRIKEFPQPRLEPDERTEINGFLLKEEQTLETYGWVDEKAGVVRIPIERAMELIAQRGLPTTPRAGTVPPSEVNVVNQAAERADVSNLPNQGRPKKPKK